MDKIPEYHRILKIELLGDGDDNTVYWFSLTDLSHTEWADEKNGIDPIRLFEAIVKAATSMIRHYGGKQ